jgi:MoaA/NifB/PqqE/SkfB family radical SAM enzyme
LNFQSRRWIEIGEGGKLLFEEALAARYGLKPGSRVLVEEREGELRIFQPVSHLAKVYIEPTNACNLQCRTCVRNSWDEPIGQMSRATFGRIVEGLRNLSPAPLVFFGGFGEPLSHPDIVEMVAQMKSLGAPVELITNGTLLTREKSYQLVEAGLDMLWVSLDGATPESYADVRLGAALPEVLSNLTHFRRVRWGDYPPTFFFDYHLKPRIGVVFVAMKRNFADLPALLRIGNQFGASRFLVTNVLPYTPEMCDEILYGRALTDGLYRPTPWGVRVELPRVDWSEVTEGPLLDTLRRGHSMVLAGAALDEENDRCPFIERGATAIGWDGSVSPCLPLLHNQITYLNEWERRLKRYVVGNVNERNLLDLWNQPEYVAFRERVQKFDFAYCIFCGGCHLLETNEEDCFGNTFPVCGGCLWAQGVIRCP